MKSAFAAILFSLVLGGHIVAAQGGIGKPAAAPGGPGPGPDWVQTGPAAVRLISERDAHRPDSGAVLGIQIRLRSGWWTYWRAPGDAGIPPVFDWSGSENLRWTPELAWPKPLQSNVFGHDLRVYRDEVVFPLRAVAADPSKPMKLRLSVIFGVCKDVCIPNAATLKLDLAAAQGTQAQIIPENQALIARFQSAVPSANQQKSGIRIENVRQTQSASGRQIVISLRRGPQTAAPIVLVETAPGEPPRPAKAQEKPALDELWSFIADLEDGPPAPAGQRVRVTVFDGGRSLEQVWAIGASADRGGNFGVDAMTRPRPAAMQAPDTSWKPKD
jgi:suppressor for copper-sensitivity B